ncbi:ArsR/SmtB family transcription factor [Granulimonas faecalis]|uniref:Transcriptional regulator n=1 Tax=Granulimonas faecalis TaxID=2894155 RepID=A0AAV5B0D1_9ACTN|nr:MarR family transcriptional regulator [Granulimonas faecalis]MBF0598819.1 helix-turn-helix transcriptional regulator [Atopobiaceae bacterium FL090493]GJM54433.1 transcriptional regulator [Granulimonas faecalis]
MEGKRDVHLRLRALGNAERLRVLAFLRNAGEATVGDVAKALSIAPGSASYHIGCLVDGGLVERAERPDGDKRKSWWRAVDGESRLEGHEEASLFQAANSAYGDAYDRYLASKDNLSDAWIEAEVGVDTVLALTVDEAALLKEELESFVRRWIEANKKTAAAQGEERGQVALVVRAFRWIP